MHSYIASFPGLLLVNCHALGTSLPAMLRVKLLSILGKLLPIIVLTILISTIINQSSNRRIARRKASTPSRSPSRSQLYPIAATMQCSSDVFLFRPSPGPWTLVLRFSGISSPLFSIPHFLLMLKGKAPTFHFKQSINRQLRDSLCRKGLQ